MILLRAGRADAIKSRQQELSNGSRIALRQQFGQRFQSDLLSGTCPAVCQSHFDQKRISTIDGRRTRCRAEELARHLLVQSLEDERLADR